MKNKTLEKIISLLFILSVPFMTLVFCINHELYYVKYLLVLSFICGIFLNYKFFNKYIYNDINIKYLIFSILFGLYTIGTVLVYSNTGITFFKNILTNILSLNISFDSSRLIVGILSVPSVIIIIYMLIKMIIPYLKEEVGKITKNEKKFIVIATIIGALLTMVIYNSTNAFYLSTYNDKIVWYDVIYTSDSGILVLDNAFLNVGMPENDVRQPLFAVFSMPFAILANFIAEFLFFIPSIYIFNIIQIFLIIISFVMIEKMLKLDEKNKLLFLVFAFSTFILLLFSFLIEQYVIAFFYLILAIYWSQTRTDKVNYLYVGAVSTLLTSGIIFPLISKFKNIKNWLFNVLKCFIAFMVFAILSSQILEFVTAFTQLERLMRFSGGELSFLDKFMQFTSFVSSLFIAPAGNVIGISNIPMYHLLEVTKINIFGLIILVCCIVSFILNRKNKMAVISFCWVLFSFFLLCVLGWGTQENGLILYGLYFSWAYIVLIYLLIGKLINNNKYRCVFILLLCAILIVMNLQEFMNIVKFGIQYYPVK